MGSIITIETGIFFIVRISMISIWLSVTGLMW